MATTPVHMSEIIENIRKNAPKDQSVDSASVMRDAMQPGPGKPAKSGDKKEPRLKIHLEICKKDPDGKSIKVVADACTVEDLKPVHYQYGGYMPKKSILSVIEGWF
jgi:hypothetical protein